MARLTGQPLPARVSRGSRLPRTYPWDQWLDGRVWELTQADDFPNATVNGFRSQAYRMADMLDLALETRSAGDTLLIQARPAKMIT